MGQHRAHGRKAEIMLARHQCQHLRPATTIRHRHGTRARNMIEQNAAKMAGRTNTARAVADRLGPCLGGGNDISDRSEGPIGRANQHIHRVEDGGNGHQIRHGIKAHIAHQGGIDRECADIGRTDGMPIRCGAGHGLRTDVTAGAGAVINHHRLPQSCL